MIERQTPPKFHAIFEYWKDKAILSDGTVVTDSPDMAPETLKNSIAVVYDRGEPSCFACDSFGLRSAYYKSGKYDSDLQESNYKRIWSESNITRLQKAHIVPHSLCGLNTPNNFFLLCESCHKDSPDTIFEKEFFKWVYKRRHHNPLWEMVQNSLLRYPEEVYENVSIPSAESIRRFAKSTTTTHYGECASATIEAIVNHIIDSVVDGTFQDEVLLYSDEVSDGNEYETDCMITGGDTN